MDLIETKQKADRALLISVDTGKFDAEASLNELWELCESAGAEPVLTVLQKLDKVESATFVGSGKLIEIKENCESYDIDLIIADSELSPTQIKTLERECGVRVIDRTTLILDIFALRAKSKEGKLQVELAQLKYLLPRLTGKGVELSRLGGGIGTRGPGETKLETDRRHIHRRMETLKDQLKDVENHRQRLRERRDKDGVITVAIVGYTNVGKSTLLNALTDAGVLAEDKLFATLDITSRAIELPDGRSVMLIDTVGLIRRLPHDLVEAFKSTLEEAAAADVILNVQDLSSPERAQQAEVTAKLLDELGCGDIPKINVLNKSDAALEPDTVFEDDSTVMISALHHGGFDKLLEMIARKLPETARRMKLLVPYDKTSFIGRIRLEGKIFSEEYTVDGTLVDALIDQKLICEAKKYTY